MGAIGWSSIGINLKCFQRHVNWANLHSNGLIQWKNTSVDRLKNFVSALPLCLMLDRPSTWLREISFLNFQLECSADASILAEQCWGTHCVQPQSSIRPRLRGTSKKAGHMRPLKIFITSKRCFQLYLVAKFFQANRNLEYDRKWYWFAIDFKERRPLELTNSFVGSSTYAWLST